MIRVLWGELRRILAPRSLLIAVLVGGLWYASIGWSRIETIGTSSPNVHRLALDLTRRLGATLEPTELSQVQAELARLTAQADALVAATPELAAAGLHTFADVQQYDRTDEKTAEVIWRLLYTDDGLGSQVETHQNVVDQYQNAVTTLQAKKKQAPTQTQARRLQQVIDDQEWHSLQSDELLTFGTSYAYQVAVVVLLMVLLLAGPLVAGDRVARVRQTQASTRTGRRLLAVQFLATLLVSAVTAGVVGVAAGLVLGRFGLFAFWNNGIQSFLTGPVYLWNWPLRSYGWCYLGLLMLVALLAGSVGFVLSRTSDSYTKLALWLTVAAILLSQLLRPIFEYPFTFDNPLTMLSGIPAAGPIALVLLTAAALLAGTLVVRAERHIDVE